MKRAYWFLAVVPFAFGCRIADSTGSGVVTPNASTSLAQRQFTQSTVVDSIRPRSARANLGPTPTTETSTYSLLNGGIHWFSGGTVEFAIVGSQPVTGANSAVVASEQTWDADIAARAFARNDNTTQTNPCTGGPNTITWGPIDGPGGIVGSTAPCYELRTKQIVGFSMILDEAESWGTNGATNLIDVADVATHEFGHAVGLGHANAPRDGCLTMYKYVSNGEIQKRTLGWGDKLGLAFLYGNTDTTPGTCGS